MYNLFHVEEVATNVCVSVCMDLNELKGYNQLQNQTVVDFTAVQRVFYEFLMNIVITQSERTGPR